MTKHTSPSTYPSPRIAASARRWGRMAGLGIAAQALVAAGPLAAPAQAQAQAQTGATVAPDMASGLVVPTTRLLAIGSFTAKATPEAKKSILPAEVRDTVRLYLAGTIDQWFVKQDLSGVVFLLNVTDPQEARAQLDRLPLGQAGLMEFQLIPLGPISPLRILLAEPAK